MHTGTVVQLSGLAWQSAGCRPEPGAGVGGISTDPITEVGGNPPPASVVLVTGPQSARIA